MTTPLFRSVLYTCNIYHKIVLLLDAGVKLILWLYVLKQINSTVCEIHLFFKSIVVGSYGMKLGMYREGELREPCL